MFNGYGCGGKTVGSVRACGFVSQHVEYIYTNLCIFFIFPKVNSNGVLSFTRSLLMYHHTDLSKQKEKTIIAPFWADVDTSRGGTVWYRVSKNPSDLRRANQEVRISFQECVDFESKWVLVSTWDNVAYYGRGSKFQNLVSI